MQFFKFKYQSLTLVFFCNFIFSFCGGHMFAQNFVYKHFNQLDAQPNAMITSFAETKDKQVFIGSSDGLFKYNGNKFLNILKKENSKFYSDPFVQSLAFDNNRYLWVATRTAVSKYDVLADSFTYFSKKNIPNLKHDLVHHIFIDRNKLIYIAPDNRNPSIYDPSGNFLYSIEFKEWVKKNNYSHKRYITINRFIQKNDAELWLCTNIGLYSLNIKTKQLTYHTGVLPFGKYWEYTDALDIGDGNLYLNTGGNGLHSLNLNNGLIESYQIRQGPEPETDNYYFWNLASYKNEQILLATFKGLGIFDIKTKTFLIDIDNSNSYFNPPANEVFNLFQDSAKSVWLGCQSEILRIDPINQLFKFNRVFTTNDTSINQVIYDSISNSYFLSTSLIDYFGAITPNSSKVKSLSRSNNISKINKILQDSQYIWIAANEGLARYDKLGREIKIFNPITKGKKEFLGGLDLTFDDKNNIWIGTISGLYYFDTKLLSLKRISPKNFDFGIITTSILWNQFDSSLWICCENHALLMRYLPYKNKWQKYQYSENKKNIFASSMPTSLTKTKDGKIWLITNPGGISEITLGKNDSVKFKNYYTQDGLPTNLFRNILSDKNSRLWLTFEDKVCCLDLNNKIIRTYGDEYGIKLSENRANLTLLQNGDITIPTSGGFYRFNPDSVFYSTEVGSPIITSFRVMNHEKKHLFLTNKTISTNYDENYINISFSSNNYQTLSESKLYYMMQGVDTTWIYADNIRDVSYPNLSYGEYMFKLKIVNSLNQVNELKNPPIIIIKPHFTQSLPFILSIIILFCLILYFFYRRKVAQIRHEAALVKELKELEGRALRSQMNPHFIFNCLNGIQETIVVQDFDAAYNYLSKFSKLMRKILNNSEKNMLPLYEEIEIIRLYLDLESIRFKNNFSYKIFIDEDIDEEEIMFPSLVLQTFVENAIWHGLQNKEGEKLLLINFLKDEVNLFIEIEDNGIGRKKANEIKSKKIGSQYFESKGTSINERRIELLNKTGSKNYTVKIIDLFNDNLSPKGTKVIIQTPLNFYNKYD